MARILILRDEAAARRTVPQVAARGHEAIVLPLQRIVPLSPPPPAGPFAAVLATSANAVPFLLSSPPAPGTPILAVGETTAAALRAGGFSPQVAADGTGSGLAERAARLAAAGRLPLLYLAGRIRTAGLEAALAARGVAVRTLEVYDTVAVEPDREAVETALAAGPPDAALLLSQGQAASFSRLLERFPTRLSPVPRPLCLSARIALGLEEALRRTALVAPRPELSALLDTYGGTGEKGV